MIGGAALAAQGRLAQAPTAPSVVPTAASRPAQARPVAPVAAHAAPVTAGLSVEGQTQLVKQYCATCHNDRAKAGGLSLAAFDASKLLDDQALAEKMIRKLRAGMMPPASARRPEPGVLDALTTTFEQRIDRAAAARVNPGARPSQRLNRAEYQRAVRDLLGIDVDITAFLPADTISDGFDNVADSQVISTALMEGYLRAASQISRLAIGDRQASASTTTVKVPRTASQMRHVEGAPLGTRGGVSFVHVFPADGEYVFKILLHSGPTGDLFGGPYAGEQIDLSINGERVGLIDINPRMNEQDPNGLNITAPPVHVKAGPQRVSAAFVSRFDGPVDDLMMPIEHTLADTNIGEVFGTTALPHIRDFSITGPTRVTGVSDTRSRRLIFTCRPTQAAEERPCAERIVRQLATRAYRGAVAADDFTALMTFYDRGRTASDFEGGVRLAVQAILASPRFLLRMEQVPSTLRAGQTYRVSDRDLASRLSFFLWGAIPDEELLKVAQAGQLSQPAVFDRQVRRMLADSRADALATRFASQWLRLQDVRQVRPDHHFYSHWDTTLSEAMVRETELFVASLLRDDRPITELLTADYTFVNERLAKHYGIANVVGSDFRRVSIPDPNRRGLLGQGSVLLLTSIADRTSPVLRGKWVMEVLLASPPPPPPPNVPSLDDSVKSNAGGKLLSTRERMEEHRKNPACTSCHRVIDPLGLALENFDATGAWRARDNGVTIDANGDLYDGTRMEGPAGLRAALLRHSDLIKLSFTESLMTYALGRRVEPFDLPTVRRIVADAGRQGDRLSAFILGVVKSPAFQMGRVEDEATTTDHEQPRR
jgi:mono/diheme cytochrome c family protein